MDDQLNQSALIGYADIQSEAKILAELQENVLISGETGVGKNAFAALIHEASMRKQGRFVRVLCPAIQSNLFESELFGHRRGSFTDAREDRIGTFEYAEGGTVYLDEIGNLAMECQAKLHHIVEERQFKRVGENEERRANVRFIFASNRDLRTLALNGKFMDDLYHRISTYQLRIPPLRERLEDLEVIARFYWRDTCLGDLTSGEVNLLLAYDFPGNVRELQNLIKRVCFNWRKNPDQCRYDLFRAEIERLQVDTGKAQLLPRKWSMKILQKMIADQKCFWDAVYLPYMNHELNKYQLKEILIEGLERSGGKWSRLLPLFRIQKEDYKKFMDFIRHQGISFPRRAER